MAYDINYDLINQKLMIDGTVESSAELQEMIGILQRALENGLLRKVQLWQKHLLRLVLMDRKVHAIMFYRAVVSACDRHCGLKEAKDFVEELYADNSAIDRAPYQVNDPAGIQMIVADRRYH